MFTSLEGKACDEKGDLSPEKILERMDMIYGTSENMHLYATVSAYAINTFASTALQGLSSFELVFARKPRHLSSFKIPKITSFPTEYREFFALLPKW